MKRLFVLGSLILLLVSLATTFVMASEHEAQFDADVIVVGGGNAGIPAAIGAARTGATVLVLEKMPYLGGTLVVSGGQLSGANSRLQIAAGFADSPEQHYRDIMAMGDFRANPRLLQKHTQNAGWTIDWLQDLGVGFDRGRPVLMDHHELYSVPRSYQPIGGGAAVASTLIDEMNRFVDEGIIEVRLQTEVIGLVQDENGGVIGVQAVTQDEEETTFHASHVVLATGGYGANVELMEKYHGDIGANALTYVPDHASGSGLMMATDIGADLTHMDFIVLYPGGIEDPERPNRPLRLRVNLSPAFSGDIWVNEEGRRFINEDTLSPDEKEIAILRQPNVTTYVVFDAAAVERNQPPVFGWSWEEFEEAAEEGQYVYMGTTITELAENAGINSVNLVATVAQYNADLAQGWDRQFDRPTIDYPISEGPFYAVKTKPMTYLTHGGLRVTDELEVLATTGQIIPGLYAVGEVIGMGQLMGRAFAGGIGNTSPITLGIMLGEELGRK